MLSTKSGIRLKDDGDLVRALGLVIMYFAHLDGDLAECLDIASLVHKHPKLTGKYATFERKRKHLIKFRSTADGPKFDLIYFDEFLRLAKACATGRNRLAHWRIVSNLHRKTIDLISPENPDIVKRLDSAKTYQLAQQILDASHICGHVKNSIVRRLYLKS